MAGTFSVLSVLAHQVLAVVLSLARETLPDLTHPEAVWQLKLAMATLMGTWLVVATYDSVLVPP